MTRVLIAVAAALGLCFASLGIAVFVTRDEDRVAADGVLARGLTKAVGELAASGGGTLDIAELTDFEWDRVVIVPRGTPRERISELAGFEFKGDLPYDVESKAIFVFVRDGELARFADYRGSLPITGLPGELSGDQASLAVSTTSVRAR